MSVSHALLESPNFNSYHIPHFGYPGDGRMVKSCHLGLQYAVSNPASGRKVCNHSELALSSRSRSNQPLHSKNTSQSVLNQTKPHFGSQNSNLKDFFGFHPQLILFFFLHTLIFILLTLILPTVVLLLSSSNHIFYFLQL